MEEEPPMSLVDDRFDDMSIEDRPVDDGGSFYNEDDLCEEEDVQPTSENFSSLNRYRPSQHHTPSHLTTIREEKHDDMRSNNSSRAAGTRPPSSNIPANQSDNSHDISSQFQFGNGINEIEKYTENFYSKQNDADRLFPEYLPQNFASPPMDKQNSWEPSVCHYEKQPTPEVMTDSPGGPHTVFGHLNRAKAVVAAVEKEKEKERENDENVQPTSTRISPERSVLSNSPLNSTKFLDAKTSTPKRPGASNRLGQRLQPPQLELSTIYALSPQRAGGNVPATATNSMFGARLPPSLATPSGQTTTSDTMLSNRTISESMVQKVLSGSSALDSDLMSALENARKKREKQPMKPDFRVNATYHRNRALAPSNDSVFSQNGGISSAAPRHQLKNTVVPMATVAEMSNCNTTGMTSNLSRLSTAKSMMASASREDLSRMSSVSKYNPRGSSTTTLPPTTNSTMMSQREHIRDGRESVNSMRTISRASTVMTSNGASSSSIQKPLRLSARRLAFGTVAVSESLTMELEIENISDRQCQVRCRMDSTTPVYQILDNKMMMIEPTKSTRLRVAFSPVSVGRYQVMLLVEVPAQGYYQKIPVWGIGGVAAIQPSISAQNMVPTGKSTEFAMYSPNLSHLSLKLENVGAREGFALLSVFDTSMNPLILNPHDFRPCRGLIIRKGKEKRVDITIDSSTAFRSSEDVRASSAMSSVSSCGSVVNARRRASASGADLVIHVAWGDEVLRQRLKQLESQTGRHQPVDGLDFTSFRFSDEPEAPSRQTAQHGFPYVVQEDHGLFASTYRTLTIFVFSSQRALTAFRSASGASARNDAEDATMMETTAFRHHTFVNDATMMPSGRR